MIQFLFLVLVAFSCFEGSDSENKCGNVEQKTVKPTTINCPNKPKITKPIWNPAPPGYLESGYLTNQHKKETEFKPSNPSCPKRNEAQKQAKEEATQPLSSPSKPLNENCPVLEQKKKPTSTLCMGRNDRREETEQEKLSSSLPCGVKPEVEPECPPSPTYFNLLSTVEQMKQPLIPVVCNCNTNPPEMKEKKVQTPKADDSGKKSSEKPPVDEKHGCSGSDGKKSEKKKTDSTHIRRPSPERPYLDI